jgi:NTE family protein
MIGALCAYETATGADLRDVDVIVGTSAGSVLAALLSVGVGIDRMARLERGLGAPGELGIDYRDLGCGLPPRPQLRIGSPRLLGASARHPRSVAPMVALAAILPRGRGTIAAVGDLVAEACRRESGCVGWPRSPRLCVVAVDYDTGERAMFGGPGVSRPPLPSAVMASCAIPGWYAPIEIAGRRYIDGGTCSPTSLDLLAGTGVEKALVLAPACSLETDRPRGGLARVERRVRRMATRRLVREVGKVRAAGIDVTVACPGPEDLAVIGGNVMDAARRTEVFETSLRTCAALFARAGVGVDACAGAELGLAG